MQIRNFEAADAAALPRFLALAGHEDDMQRALANPDLARYIEDFGREGDCAVVATHDEKIIGVAWARFWTREDFGFGWIDELTPEMAIAVAPEFRNQGIGARLIEALKCRLRAVLLAVRWDAEHQMWVPADVEVRIAQPEMGIGPDEVVLNVRADSNAVRLYEKLGFERIEGSERTNRTGSQSFNMSAPLQNGSWREGTLDRSIHTNWAGAPEHFVSVDYRFALRRALFSASETLDFEELMRGLPGNSEEETRFDGGDWITQFAYFGCAPVKAAVHWAHLWAQIDDDGLRVRGDLEWAQWCEWEDAFLAGGHRFPHAVTHEATEPAQNR